MLNLFKKFLITSSLIVVVNSNLAAANSNFLNETYLTIGAGRVWNKNHFQHAEILTDNELHYIKRKLKNNNIYKASVGKSFDPLRLELEFILSDKKKFSADNTAADGAINNYKFNIKSQAIFINSFYDFKTMHPKFVPYVGIGFGIANNKLSNEVSNDFVNKTFYTIAKKNKKSFAGNFSVGSKFLLNRNLFLDISYRYIHFGKLKGAQDVVFFNGKSSKLDVPNVKGKLRSHAIMASIGFKY